MPVGLLWMEQAVQCPTCREHFLEPLNGCCPQCGVLLEEDPFANVGDAPGLTRSASPKRDVAEASASAREKTHGWGGATSVPGQNDSAEGVESTASSQGGNHIKKRPSTPNVRPDPCGYEDWVRRSIELARTTLSGVEVVSRKEIQNGVQVRLKRGVETATVNFYTTGTTVVNQSSTQLCGDLNSVQWPPYERQEGSHGGVNRTFYILDVTEASLRRALEGVERLSIRPLEPEMYITHDWKLLRDSDTLRLRVYTTERVVLQGKRSQFASEVELALENEMVRSHLEYSNPPRQKAVPRGGIEDAEDQVSKHIGEAGWRFLSPERQVALAYSWHQIQYPLEGLENFSCIISMTVPALEEFLVRFAHKTGVGSPTDRAGRSQIGEWLKQFKEHVYFKNNTKAIKIVKRLEEAWRERHRYAHADRASRPSADLDACREQMLKWLDFMRDAAQWVVQHGST